VILLPWLTYGDDDVVAFVHDDFTATISCWTVVCERNLYYEMTYGNDDVVDFVRI
nr:hypothetical protein [Tanacetum cinerariifolium]